MLKLQLKLINIMSDLQLSTMTLDGKITNIRFDKQTAIHGLYTYKKIIKIGCNYGTHISDTYESFFHSEKPKTNRGRKPKKIETSRKKQGNGSHFNSQITFTIVNETDTSIYQVKLFTNGRLQIPGIGAIHESFQTDSSIQSIISILVEFINENRSLQFNSSIPSSLEYLTPILQNYKFKLDLQENIEFLDLFSLKKEFTGLKELRNFHIKIHSIIFHPERYAGLLIKFSTPELLTESSSINKFIELVKLYRFKKMIKRRNKKQTNPMYDDAEQYAKVYKVVAMLQSCWMENNKVRKKVKARQTTVKVFKSGKINIDSANSFEEADQIRQFIIDEIQKRKELVVYTLLS